uniref:Uncharacterized protein MANES_04G008200 n=1 Tax=Rhizophora mucronata TaxID=61149 RepID=A0A2P2IYR2_RHIMU
MVTRPGESLSSYFVFVCFPTNPSSSTICGNTSTVSSFLAALLVASVAPTGPCALAP